MTRIEKFLREAVTFTDEDLARLKEYLNSNNRIYPGIMGNEMKALLARLAAAELPLQWANRIGHMQECGVYKGSAICSCGFHQFYSAYEAWRKACGK